jgi:hypothetical protein
LRGGGQNADFCGEKGRGERKNTAGSTPNRIRN